MVKMPMNDKYNARVKNQEISPDGRRLWMIRMRKEIGFKLFVK
jgi:hypothetical protein